MRRFSTFLVIAAILALSPDAANAQRRGRGNGKVYGPGGLMYDTQSPEWRAAGGNIFLYQEIMQAKAFQAQQKVMARQMQQMARQQQAFDKWLRDQKARKDKGLPTDPQYDQYMKMVAQAEQEARAAEQPRPHRRLAKSKAPKAKAARAKTVAKDDEGG